MVMEDEKFARMLQDRWGPLLDDWFFTKIVGVVFANPDGSSRQELLRSCRPSDLLDLLPEPENPIDPKAVGVYIAGAPRRQLGYLPERTAHDLLRELGESGCQHLGVMKNLTFTPEGKLVGANIAVVRLLNSVWFN